MCYSKAMDTSKTYIEMCKKAEEIQRLRPIVADDHDYFYCKVHGFGCDLDKAVWLPRQDQLQEMLSIGKSNTFTGLLALQLFIEDNAKYEMLDWSMEQLWLAFVMKSLYQKVWNGKEWVK